MGSNYSTNFNMPSVDTKINNNVLQQTNAADNYDRYQYQDNTIRQAAGDVVTDVIGNSRSKVRKKMPREFSGVIDELLYVDNTDDNKTEYYSELINSNLAA